MAKTTDFLSQTSGKLTDQFVTRQTAFGTILARAPKKTANARRSERQANMRCQLANMSANFKLYQGKLKLAWENKKTGLSEYNCFVASNYDKNPVYITKSMRVAGACVLAESIISSGSLPPIDTTVNGEGFMVSDLKLGGLVIDAQTTVADLTIAILQNNAEWEDGDQLTWFYGVQRVDSAGTPRASLTAEKVVLDTTNETALWSVVSAVGFSSVNGEGFMVNDLQLVQGEWLIPIGMGGEDIEKRKYENRYGTRFYENVSKDLKHALGLSEGLSPTTIKYTHYFYQLYSPLFVNRQQGVDESVPANRQQGVDEFEMLFLIPWSHHTRIIDKVKGNGRKGLFFVRKSLENNWGRGVLLNFLSTDLYERQGASQTNFALTMPALESDLAQELLKSPYDFRFLPGKEKYVIM